MEKTGRLNGPALPQLRREARLRREYLYRKAREEAERTAQERKDKVRRALEGTCVPRFPIFSRDLSFKTQRETCPKAVKGVYLAFTCVRVVSIFSRIYWSFPLTVRSSSWFANIPFKIV